MKNWWPWRKRKSLSLFEGAIPYTRLSVGRERPLPTTTPDQPHRMNAPGQFYVVNQDCMTCGYPHILAPDLMAWEMDSGGRETHCYFRKQPETSQEVEQALRAVEGSCCGALRYCGSDPEIIQKLKDAGCKEAIDRL
jgi:hypothetical protein